MRKFIFLAFGSGLLSALISEVSFINWYGALIFYLVFLVLNIIYFLAYQYDDLFINSLTKTLKKVGIESPESFNLAIIVMWIIFNVVSIIWRWSYVK
jgi:hypothetical protein